MFGATCVPDAHSERAVNQRFQLGFATGSADVLCHDLPAFENEKHRNGADAEIGGEGLLVVHVDLGDLCLAAKFGGEFIQSGSHHFARTAPLGPEVHEHWGGGLKHFALKIILCERDDICSSHVIKKLSS